jgi:hypothetical protein
MALKCKFFCKNLKKLFILVCLYWILIWFGILTSYKQENMSTEKHGKNRHQLVYKKLDAYESLYSGLFNRTTVLRGHENVNRFIVVTPESREDKNTNLRETKDDVKLTSTELKAIFKLFQINKIVLVDLNILKETNFKDQFLNISSRLVPFNTYEVFENSRLTEYLKNDDSLFLTFGYIFSSIKKLKILENVTQFLFKLYFESNFFNIKN